VSSSIKSNFAIISRFPDSFESRCTRSTRRGRITTRARLRKSPEKFRWFRSFATFRGFIDSSFVYLLSISIALNPICYNILPYLFPLSPLLPSLPVTSLLIPHFRTSRILLTLLLDLPIDFEQLCILVVVTLESISSNFRIRPRNLINLCQSPQDISMSDLTPHTHTQSVSTV